MKSKNQTTTPQTLLEGVVEKESLTRPIVAILIVALIGTLPYVQSLWFDYTLDDIIYTTQNTATSAGLERWTDFFKYGSLNFFSDMQMNSGSYRPMTLLSFGVEKSLFGKFSPMVGHGINLILYMATLVLVGLILRFLFKKQTLFPPYTYLIILALYALHPLHVEVVASVKSRDSLLASTFGMGALYVFIVYYQSLRWPHYLGISVAYFISLFSKEEAITFGGLAVLLVYFAYENLNFRDLLTKISPFVGVVVLYMLTRAAVLEKGTDSYNNILNSVLFAAKGVDKISTNFYIYLYYFRFLFFPFRYAWDYSYGEIGIVSFANPWVWVSILTFGALVYFCFKNIRSRSLIVFGILFYLIAFSVYSNLLPDSTIGSNLGHRFLFIPSLGACVAVVCSLCWVVQKYIKNNQVFIGLSLILGIILTLGTVQYAKAWKNDMALSEYSIRNAPQSFRVHLTYAIALKDLGTATKKRSYITKAIEELGVSEQIVKKGKAYNERIPLIMTECYLQLKDSTAAIKSLQSIPPDLLNPTAKYILTKLLFQKKQYDAAVGNLLSFDPTKLDAGLQVSHLNMLNQTAYYYLNSGRIADSKELFLKIDRLYPNRYEALSNLAFIAFQHDKDYPLAIQYYNQSLNVFNEDKINYFQTYYNLGSIYVMTQNTDKAITAFENALKYGANKGVFGNLYLLYQSKNNTAKAAQYLELFNETN